MKTTYRLALAEKPSVAQSIAAVLEATDRKDGFFIGNGWIVSWCCGHLVELAAPGAYGEEYKRWNRAALPILPETWKYAASEGKKKQLDILRSLMSRADVTAVVNACDAGREGELIFRLVYNYCKCKKPVQRLWISSLEDVAIREGFAGLRPGADYDSLYRAALCRARADWLVGINATRLFSCLYGSTLNVGRVQSPTLALLVQREAAIAAFTSEPFYTPHIDCGVFAASGERLPDREAAESVLAACDGRSASVLSVEKAEKTAAPPKLFDLTSLQREANRLLGFTARQTLDYAQSLYEKKLLTYPRTDSRYLTEGMAAGLEKLVNLAAMRLPFIKVPLSVNAGAVIDGKRVTDHHAIIPTANAGKSDLAALPSGEREVLNMVIARLVCATAPAHTFEAVTAIMECGGHRFTAKGRTVLVDGWKAIDAAFRAGLKNKPDADEDGEEDSALPDLTEGRAFPSVTASVREGKTKPPARFTEGTLLRAMETAGAEDFPGDAERKGLGTPATRAGVIEKLIKGGFAVRLKKQLVPTEKGTGLIAILPEDIKSPLLTADWEQKLKLVENNALSDADFMAGIAALTKGLVAANTAPPAEYASLFAAPPKGSVIGKCPRCGADVTEEAKGFFCSGRACKFALWKDSRFWAAKGKKLDKKTAAALLSEGRVSFSDLKSEKTGKTYAATVVLTDADGKTEFKLEFDNNGRKIA
ncbi:MAG: DNA topoisomerase 3 [Clostridiales Family XIII bacterium]|jgi:DNA topoisomerase-3|nr:DNA topoisomerase 3 [Clostridiales Family XIII bacterium]